MTRRWCLAPTVVAIVVFGAACSGGDGAPSRGALPGFSDISYRIERPGAGAKTGCAFLATTTAQQERGLMNVRDLLGHAGMIFQFPSDVDNNAVGFYMKDTPMALSIAWFDRAGRFVSSADMAPERETPVYHATAPYRFAFEVPQGKLGAAGIGPGASLVVDGAC